MPGGKLCRNKRPHFCCALRHFNFSRYWLLLVYTGFFERTCEQTLSTGLPGVRWIGLDRQYLSSEATRSLGVSSLLVVVDWA